MTQEKKTIEINLNEVQFFNLKKQPVKYGDLNEYIGNLVFVNARTVPVSEIASDLYKTGKAEAGRDELLHLIYIINSNDQMLLLLKNGVVTYLQIKLAELTGEVEVKKEEKVQEEKVEAAIVDK